MIMYPAILFHYKQGYIGVVNDWRHELQITKQIGGNFTRIPIEAISNWEEIKHKTNIKRHELKPKGTV